MSDLRFDPISNQWITVARNRRDRPMEFIPLQQTRQQLICPFCKGNEDETPDAYAAYHEDGSRQAPSEDASNWTVRVIPNKFPSFGSKTESTNGQSEQAIVDEGPYRSSPMPGAQELIIASPRHVSSLSELTDRELALTFSVYQDRIKNLKSQDHIEHAMLFMNCRHSAGASLSHIHTQLIGSPVVSDFLNGRAQRNREYVDAHQMTLIEGLTLWEIEQKSRIIFESDNFCIYCPYASRFPFQTRIVPKREANCFVSFPGDLRDELAMLCRRLVTRMEELLGDPGYNMLLHIAPFSMAQHDHFYFEIFPRLTRAAGFEWGTDIWVNPVAPETAARQIRVDA